MPANKTKEEMTEQVEILMTSYGNEILRLCFMYLKDYHLAQDAFQETFLRAYKGYGKYRKDSTERTWISKIAINVCKDILKSSWNKKVDLVREIFDQTDIREEKDDALLQEVMMLSPKYKEVVLLYYYQEFKINEISKILGISETAVNKRLARAKDKLKNNGHVKQRYQAMFMICKEGDCNE